MAKRLGVHSPLLAAARTLLTAKGRRERGRFLFEGPTLLEEAYRSALEITAVYVTAESYERTRLVRELERHGVPVMLIGERSAVRLSDVQTPTGVVAEARQRFERLESLLARPGPAVVLAKVADPGNAGTVVRSAEAFGAAGVIFGRGGVEPYHPKVIRSAMGSLFRVPIAVCEPKELQRVAEQAGRPVVGLSSHGGPMSFQGSAPVLIAGQERRGLGPFAAVCSSYMAIPMRGLAESLNVAVATSIALYEAREL